MVKKRECWKRRTWWGITGICGAALVVVLTSLPTMVAQSTLRHRILPAVLEQYPAGKTLDRAYLGWFQPVVLTDVKLADMNDHPLAHVRQITTRQDLLPLIARRGNGAVVQLDQPTVHLRYDGQSLNVFEVFRSLAASQSSEPETVDRNLTFIVDNGRLIDSGDVPLGFTIESVDSSIRFVGENILVSDLQAKVEQGRLRASPRVLLDPSGPIVLQRDIAILDGVVIDPDRVNHWISFVAPVLSGATRVSGELSAEVHSVSIPLDRPTDANATGKLRIHATSIEAGPLSEAVIEIGRRLYAVLERPRQGSLPNAESWEMSVPEQTVSFRIADGLVYHDHLILNLGPLQISTTGSIGFDETLGITLKTYIPPSWVDESELLESLANEEISFLVAGTMSEPTINDAALIDLVERLGTTVVLESVADALERPVLDLLGF